MHVSKAFIRSRNTHRQIVHKQTGQTDMVWWATRFFSPFFAVPGSSGSVLKNYVPPRPCNGPSSPGTLIDNQASLLFGRYGVRAAGRLEQILALKPAASGSTLCCRTSEQQPSFVPQS